MAAIVTTFRLSYHFAPVESFIVYHLSIGFDHLFLFYDDCDERTCNFLNNLQMKYGDDSVTIFIRDKTLVDLQKIKCSRFDELFELSKTEVPARQTLNAQYAYVQAEYIGLKWLLHIDIDEIFYIDDSITLLEHFEYLDSIGVQTMTYLNHEGVPESFESQNYFLTTTLFRRHPFSLDLSASNDKALSFWKNRTFHKQYFLIYDNGKSAVRLGVGAVPRDVHRWQLPSSSCDENYDRRERTAIADPRSLQVSNVLPMSTPCVLHYVTCGFGWLQDKYKILGSFPAHWLGGRLPIAPSFHLDARDAAAADRESGDDSQLRQLYRSQVLFSPESFTGTASERQEQYDAELRQQLDSGVLLRLVEVRQRLVCRRRLGESAEESSPQAAPQHCERLPAAAPPAPPVEAPTYGSGVSDMDRLRILSQAAQRYLI